MLTQTSSSGVDNQLPSYEPTSDAAPSIQPRSPTLIGDTVVLDGRTYTRHSHHWYDDGSVGFLVENTAFLLHRTFLAKRSTVLAALLPPSQPDIPEVSKEADRTVAITNGIPFFVLHDKAEDFSNVLDIIYTDITMDGDQRSLDVATLMGIVQFAHKYLLEKVKRWGVAQLTSSHSLLVLGEESYRTELEAGRYSDPKFCVQVIQFARECQLPQFLQLPFYALSTTEWDSKPSTDFFSMDKLSQEDRWRIQQGRLPLMKALLEQACNMPENGGARERCDEAQCVLNKLKGPTARWAKLLLHPLEELEFRSTAKLANLCSACQKLVRGTSKALRDDLVSHLNEFFGLLN